MKKKILFMTLLFMSFLVFVETVKADAPLKSGLSKGNARSGYYDESDMKITAKQGDSFKVYFYYDNWDNECYNYYHQDDTIDYCEFDLEYGNLGLLYSEGLEFVKIQAANNNVPRNLNIYNDYVTEHVIKGYNALTVDFSPNGLDELDEPYRVEHGITKILEIEFKVVNTAKDDTYYIIPYHINDSLITRSDDENDFESFNSGGYMNIDDGIDVVVGTGEATGKRLVSPSAVKNSTYIIGTKMFTRDGSEKFNGILTTKNIMEASKTIDSKEMDDMVIYYKNAYGNWIEAISNKPITPPSNFEIQYIDNIPVGN
jgi:hypothetical protein